MNNTSSPLKAFKRVTSLELSKWYMGMLLTNPAETPDTNGAFSLLEATLAPGAEPPPHVHTREDELFYVLEGEFDVYVGEEAFNGKNRRVHLSPQIQAACNYCPLASASRAHAIRPRRAEETFGSVGSPAQNLEPPTGALTYSTADLEQTVQPASARGVRILAPVRLRANCPCTLNRFH